MPQCFCTVEKCQELEQRIEALEALLQNHFSQSIPAAHNYTPSVNVGIGGSVAGDNLVITSSVSVDSGSDSSIATIPLPKIDDVSVGLNISNQTIEVSVSVEGISDSASANLPVIDLPVNVDISAAANSSDCSIKFFTRVDVGGNSSNDSAEVSLNCFQFTEPPFNPLPPFSPPVTPQPPDFNLPPLPPINPPDFGGGGGSGGGGSGNTGEGIEPPDFGGSVTLDVSNVGCLLLFTVTTVINGRVSTSQSNIDLSNILLWDFFVGIDEGGEEDTLVSQFELCGKFVKWEIPFMAGECDLTPLINLINVNQFSIDNNFALVNNKVDLLSQVNNVQFDSLTLAINNVANLIIPVINQFELNMNANFVALFNLLNLQVLVKLDATLELTAEINLIIEEIKEETDLESIEIYNGICKEKDNVYSYERQTTNSGITSFGIALKAISEQLEKIHTSVCESLNDNAVKIEGEAQLFRCEAPESDNPSKVEFKLNPIPNSTLKYDNLNSALELLYNTIINVWSEVCNLKLLKVPLPSFPSLFKCAENEEGDKELQALGLDELRTLSFYQRYESLLSKTPNPNDIDPNTGRPRVELLSYPPTWASYLYNSVFIEAANYSSINTLNELCTLELDSGCQILVDDKSVYAAYGLYLALYWQWDNKNIKTGIHQTPLRNPISQIVDSTNAEQTWNTYFSDKYRVIGNQWALLWTEDENGNGYKLPWCQGWFENKAEAKRYLESIVTLTTEIPRSANNPSYSDKDNKQTNVINDGERQTLRKVCLVRKTPNSNEVIVLKSFSKPRA